jgi:copper homeostasis protein
MPDPGTMEGVLEVCVESLSSALAAQEGGADRVELCAALDVGGLTPAYQLAGKVVRAVDIPVHAMVRPRAGDFTCSTADFELMKEAVGSFRRLGCAGIVTGILTPDGVPDADRVAELVRLAGPMEVTFHRAIDEAVDILAAASIIAPTGVRRILTSGGAGDASAGAGVIRRLVEEHSGMSMIAAGGITVQNAADIRRATGVRELHSWSGVSDARGEADPNLVRSLKEAITVHSSRP